MRVPPPPVEAERVHAGGSVTPRESVMEPSSSVRTKPGEIDVVRTTPSLDSWRNASITVRTAFFVAAYTPWLGTIFRPAVDTVVDEVATALAPEHRHRSGDTVQHSAQVHVDHRIPTRHVAVGERTDRADARVGHQHVEPAEVLDRGVHQRDEIPGAADVDGGGAHFGAVAAQLGGECVEAVGAPGAQHDACAAVGRAGAPSPRRSRCWPR